MKVLDGIRNLLWADAGFRAACPGGIAPVLLPEGVTLPAVTYHRAGGSTTPTLSGSGVQQLRLQFDVHGADAASAEAGRTALRAVLEGFRGPLDTGVELSNVQYIQSIDFFDNAPRQFRVACEFRLSFNSND